MESVTRQLDQLYLDVEKRRKIESAASGAAFGGAFLLGPVGAILAEQAYKSGKYDPGEDTWDMSYGYYETARTQYAQLIGELEVLEKASILKKCDKKMLPEIPEYRKDFSAFTNKRTRVFHRYECQRRNEDFLEYKSAKEARDAGGMPCKHCKPRDMTIAQERLKKGR
jgi:hypothetical protein